LGNCFLQQFALKPATNKNIKPIAGLRPATLFVVGYCKASPCDPFCGGLLQGFALRPLLWWVIARLCLATFFVVGV
jgi:hypothetical protein